MKICKHVSRLGVLLMIILNHLDCIAGTPGEDKTIKHDGHGLTAKYAMINGMEMYYVAAGEGRPVALLHGAFSMIDKDFGNLIPSLVKQQQVIGIELQGHGHIIKNGDNFFCLRRFVFKV